MRPNLPAGLALLLLAGAAQAQSPSPGTVRQLPPLNTVLLQAGSFDARGFDPLGLPVATPRFQGGGVPAGNGPTGDLRAGGRPAGNAPAGAAPAGQPVMASNAAGETAPRTIAAR